MAAVLLVVGLGFLVAPPGARGEDVQQLRASALASRNRCPEALAIVEQARAAGTAGAGLLVVGGQCRIRLQNYPEAVALLEEARAIDPGHPRVDLYLGMARFHLGDMEGAEEAIEAAARRSPDDAQVNLYLGLILLQNARNAEAAAALDRARLADPDSVEPVASFYAGQAWIQADERARAEEAFRRVRERAPGSAWANEADRALARMEAPGPGRWWASATSGFEYDTNVVLKGSGVTLPSDISSQRDVRGVLSVEGGLEFLRTRAWTVGGIARFYMNEHDDLGEFELLYPTLTLWADYRIGEGLTARGQYDFSYGWVDAEPFVMSHTWTAALYKDWGLPGRSRFFGNYYRYDYKFDNQDVPDGPGVHFFGNVTEFDNILESRCLDVDDVVCGPPGINESRDRNRDGHGQTFGFEHRLPLGRGNVELRGGYSFLRYSARGSEYSFTGHSVLLGARVNLPCELVLDLFGRYSYKPYRNNSSFPDPQELFRNQQYRLANHNRRDNVIQFDAQLERKLTSWLSASVRYTYIRNRSDVAVFDYRREIIGAYLTVRFQQLGG